MPSWSERPRTHQVPCEVCNQPGQMSQQLNPANWQPTTRRLCRHHRERLGFHLVDYSRGQYGGGRTPGA